MAFAKSFTKEKLVVGCLISRESMLMQMRAALAESFGPIDFESESLPFDYTHYYDDEMGTPIQRIFLAFRSLLSPDLLAEAKSKTNAIENLFRVDGKRKINLDPGCMSLSRFMLATTKEGAFRIPLHSGIYAEVTLVFEKGKFRSLEWTYPDYKSLPYCKILKKIRNIYKTQL